jgi:hypothetical protein
MNVTFEHPPEGDDMGTLRIHSDVYTVSFVGDRASILAEIDNLRFALDDVDALASDVALWPEVDVH